ncbi:MAG: ABC transporter ATP-binding protein [Gammaproteobacteria bacterium]
MPISPDSQPVIDISSLVYEWPNQQPVIDIPELTIARGERVFLAGPSGSGKSTLLGLIGGVLSPAAGEIDVLGTSLTSLSVAQRDKHRSDYVGFIFQLFNLLPYLSVIDNVTLPCRFSARREARATQNSDSIETEARRLLEHLDITPELMMRQVNELSIGQQQRVAAARALIGAPELLIADEPTSALDHDLRSRFIDLLLSECEAANSAVLFVSHDTTLGPLFDRQLTLAEINRGAQIHKEQP